MITTSKTGLVGVAAAAAAALVLTVGQCSDTLLFASSFQLLLSPSSPFGGSRCGQVATNVNGKRSGCKDNCRRLNQLHAENGEITTTTTADARRTGGGTGGGGGSFNIRLNEFFKKPVPPIIREAMSVQRFGDRENNNARGWWGRADNDDVLVRQGVPGEDGGRRWWENKAPGDDDVPIRRQAVQQVAPGEKTNLPDGKESNDIWSLLWAPPSNPGFPRPLWLVILGSVPTGLLWYGYYKFAVEEELLDMELSAGREPRGFGGYGTLGPFVYLCLLGPLAFVFHLPGGMDWVNLGIIFIYYTQFLLYDRVNELYREIDQEEPLQVWWCLPIFFPFDLIVGLRQVHYLSKYHYIKRGVEASQQPTDPVVEFFPFIGAPRYTWQQFLLTPSLWCKWFENAEDIDRTKLPRPIQQLLSIGEGGMQGTAMTTTTTQTTTATTTTVTTTTTTN